MFDCVESLTGFWAQQGLQVWKSRGCLLQVQPIPGGSTVPGMPGVAPCDRGMFKGPIVMWGCISTEAIVTLQGPALTQTYISF